MSPGPDSRYAVYLAPPPDSALHTFAARWLGRDVASGEVFPAQAVDGVSADAVYRVTTAPRVYGFHATLKPPFRLRHGATPEMLQQKLRTIAARQLPFQAPPLELGLLVSFLALVLSGESDAMRNLADTCVEDLDPLRKPPTARELERRRRGRHSERQLELIDRWGYPYVFEQWRFHMTLTGSIADPEERAHFQRLLTALTAPFCGSPWTVDAIALFEQHGEGDPFLITRRFPLGEGGA